MADSPNKFYLEISIGEGTADPVSGDLARTLSTAEISLSDEVPSGFQLVFQAQLSADDNDYDLMQEPLLKEFNRVVLKMIVDEKPTMLMDGYITNKELDETAKRVTITGEDLSLKMGLMELCKSYPEKSDSAIATEVLGRYSSIGVTAEVVAPDSEVTPSVFTPQQLATDLDYLQLLAARNNHRFYIKFDSKAIGYWGPPERDGAAQPALTSDQVMFGNAHEMNPTYDPVSPVLYYGSKLTDGDSGKESVDTPFGSGDYGGTALAKTAVSYSEFTSLALDPESYESKLSTLSIKGKYMRHQGLDPGQAAASAQAPTDLEVGKAAVLEGVVDTADYGYLIKVPGVIGVRGVGKGFDGDYYIQSVTHKMDFNPQQAKYTQSFKLLREGMGAKKPTVVVK